MKRILLFWGMAATMCVAAFAIEMKTYENAKFSIGYHADWEESWSGEEWVNFENADGDISFNITYNEVGPTKAQLQEAVDNYVYMVKNQGQKVEQQKVREDYALVRTIKTDEDDGTQSVETWFLIISKEPEGFSGSVVSPIDKANDALDIMMEMLGTLSPK